MKQLTTTIVTLVILTFFSVTAQQDAQYTQYMYNTAVINPAYTGSRDKTSVSGLTRKQWVGFEGSPATHTIAFETPFDRFSNFSYGFSVFSDIIRPTTETNFNIDFAYRIRVNNKNTAFLRLGSKIGGNLLNVNLTRLSREEAMDNALLSDINNKFSPNFGLGAYYHNEKFYAGLSIPNLLQTSFFDEQSAFSSSGTTSLLAKQKINYYFITGHTFDLSYNVKFKPALLTKMVIGAPLQVDISANFLIFQKITLGTAYRWSAAVSGLFGYQLSKSLMLGLSYDVETTELTSTDTNYGSFEFVLRYDLKNKLNLTSKRMLTPRFF
ncbi:PorP/SprF family type IX secretion system membrane protein [Aquimarina agarilytica]|uniref:PorP/SprF family type IX secretion system membrane protein n=1 Tax=Aquimarina agarilytica TaxID=1087449 RepID=UPI000288391F|nr:type IX secretion system membrane protein PorP/SprF [Aquimarina agarilytica]